MLQDGLLWRVGDGNKIHTYEDNWIPGITSGTLQHISLRSGNDMVSSFIIEGEQKWKEETVRNIFPEDIAEKILSNTTEYRRMHRFCFMAPHKRWCLHSEVSI